MLVKLHLKRERLAQPKPRIQALKITETKFALSGLSLICLQTLSLTSYSVKKKINI